jgi:hypothetical protein
MKLFRKEIETAEALRLFIETAEQNSEKQWPQVLKQFSRAKVSITDEDEAKRAWLIAVLATDTYLMGESRNMSQAELTNVYAALDARFAGVETYEYFRGLVLFSMTSFASPEFGKLYPLMSGLMNVLRFGFKAAIEIEEEGDPDELAGSHPALLRNVGAIFSMQLTAWKRVFENYKVIFTRV